MRWTTVLFAGLLVLGGLQGPARAAPKDAQASKACVECHDSDDLPDMSQGPHAPRKAPPMKSAAEAMQGSPMADGADPRIPDCISCHGASPTHAKKPEGAKERPRPDIVFGKLGRSSTQKRNATCRDCHDHDAKQALWAGSAHDAADVACNNCHKVHTNKDRTMVKATQADTCYACHKEQRTQLARVSHHPVPEGKMTCADCHAVHGSAGPKLALRDSTNATCFGCHTEKRGPFVHPHEPATDDCASCHQPHGSTVAAMLKARPPLLCQQCHTPHVAGGVGAAGPQPFPGAGVNNVGKNVVSMWQGRSCLNCHTQVHGSNNPSVTNPTPNLLFR